MGDVVKTLARILFSFFLCAALCADVNSLSFTLPSSCTQNTTSSFTVTVYDETATPTPDVAVTILVISGNATIEQTATTDALGQIQASLNAQSLGELLLEAQAGTVTAQATLNIVPEIIPDTEAPTLVTFSYTTSINPTLIATVQDNGEIAASSNLLLNGVTLAPTISTPNLTFTLPEFLHYGLTVNAVLTIIDTANNVTTASYSWLSDLPPTPSAIVATWLDGGINSADDQHLRINRPLIPAKIDAWTVSITTDSQVTTHVLTTADATYDFGPVSDNQTVSIAVQLKDIVSNVYSPAATTSIVIGDRTAPQVVTRHYTTGIFSSLVATINESSALATSTNLVLNGITLSPTVYPSSISFTLTEPLHYGITVNAYLTIIDAYNNITTTSYSWITDLPTMPTISATWLDGGINSLDDQYIRIDRPIIPPNIDTWIITITTNSQTTTQILSTGNAFYELGPVSDNQTVSIAMLIRDTISNAYSPIATTALTINDRTPPEIFLAEYTNSVTTSFIVTAGDDSVLTGTLSINGQVIPPAVVASPQLSFVLPQPLHYGTTVSALLSVLDIENNITTAAYTWTTELPIPPEPPLIAWLDQGFNSLDTQIMSISRPFIPAGIDTWLITITSNSGTALYLVPSAQPTFDIGPVSDNQTVSVAVALADSVSAVTTDYSLETTANIPDRTPPVIGLPVYGTAITPNIAWTISDADSALDWNFINVTIRGANWPMITDNYTVTVDPTTLFHYGEAITATLSIQDALGNSATQKVTFTTELPPTAAPPAITWLPSSVNSTSNQYIRVTRPTPPANDLEAWSVSSVYGNGLTTTFNIPLTKNSVILGPLDDNQIIACAISFVDSHTGAISPESMPITCNIGDRTPPIIQNINHTSSVSTNISANIIDTHSNIDPSALTLNAQGQLLSLETINLPEVVFNPPINFHYGETVTVTLSITDLVGNTAETAISWTTEQPPTPTPPVINWIDQGFNTGDAQKIQVTRPAAPADMEFWSIFVSGNGLANTLNIPIAQATVTITDVPDDQIVTAAIQWRDSHTDSYSSLSVLVTTSVHDRTPPIIDSVYPAENSTNVAVTQDLSTNIHDVSSELVTASLTWMVNGSVYTGTYTLAHPDFEYNATIPVTLSIYDAEGNSVTKNYVFTTKTDLVKPQISALIPLLHTQGLESPTTLSFTVTDNFSGISINSLSILANGLSLTANISYNTLTEVDFSCRPTWDYWTTFNVTISITDIANNTCIVTTDFKTTTTDIHDITNDRYYGTIGEAFARIPTYSTLVLAPRVYQEHGLIITKSFTLNAAGATLDAERLDQHFNYVQNAVVTINNLTLIAGYATDGGVASGATGGTLVLNNCRVQNNEAINGGVAYNLNLLADHCLFTGNIARDYGAISYLGSTSFKHSILYGNTAPSYVISRSDIGTPCIIYNSIVWNNSPVLFTNTTDPAVLSVNYSNVQAYAAPMPGINNISQTPVFANTITYNLQPADPGIEKGCTTSGHISIYDAADIGLNEYQNIYISNVALASSSNVDILAPFICRIRNTVERVATETLQVTLNNQLYTGPSLNLLETTSKDVQLSFTPQQLAFNATVTFAVQAMDSSYTHVLTGSYSTRTAGVKSVTFTSANMNLLAESTKNITVVVLNELDNPVAGATVVFSFVCSTTNGTTLAPVSAITNALGEASTVLALGSGNATVTLYASSSGTNAAPATVNVSALIRFISNIRLNKDYLSFSEAFSDAALTANDSLVISKSYTTASAEQKPISITWPSVNNITLQGNGITLSAPIIFSQPGLTATITSISFSAINDSAIQGLNIPGTTLSIQACSFSNINNSAIRLYLGAALFIRDCLFIENTGTNGGAINASQINRLEISDTRCSSNQASNGGALFISEGTKAKILRSRFSSNSAVYGQAIYASLSSQLECINSLFTEHNTGAVETMYISQSPTTLNFCTIADNALGLSVKSTSANIYNSILWNTLDVTTQSAQVNAADSIINGLSGNNCITANPLFITDHALSIASPALDHSTTNRGVTNDILGTSRPQWLGYDIGAYEVIAQDPVYLVGIGYFPTIQDALDAATNNSIIQLREQTYTLNTPVIWPTTKNNITLIGANNASRNVIIRPAVSCPALFTIPATIELTLSYLTLTSANNALVVTSAGPATITLNNVYATSLNAQTTTFNGSLVYARQGANIAVQNSLLENNTSREQGGLFYSETGTLNLNITNTVISTINVISTGEALGGGAVAVRAIASLTQTTLNNCSASIGGAFKQSTLNVSNSYIRNCRAVAANNPNGGGFAQSSQVTISRTIFIGASSTDSGGVFFGCRGTILNSIFYKNTSTYFTGGSIADPTSSLQFTNSVFLGNTAEYTNPSISLNNCNGDHSLPGLSSTANPRFLDPENGNFQVTYNSPLIDTGAINSSYVYDSQDIGLREYTGTFINIISPLSGSLDQEPTTSVRFRIRNAEKRILPNSLSVVLNNRAYNSGSLTVTVTDNSSATTTDIFIAIVPTPAPFYSSTVTVALVVDNTLTTMHYTIIPPQKVYISNSGNDLTNDGSAQYPFRTFAKAAAIIRDDGVFVLLSQNYTDSLVWPNAQNIQLWGTSNATLLGNITIPSGITASIQDLSLKGTIYNSGRLSLERTIVSQSVLAVSNNGSIRLTNSFLLSNTTAIQNNGTAFVAYSNLVNNTTQLAGNGSTTFINTILYGHNQLATGTAPLQINCLITTPDFTDGYFILKHNSPAVDAATTSFTVTADYRGQSRPQHHLPDIGAYESAVPAIYLLYPIATSNLGVETTFNIRVVDTLATITTTAITCSITNNSLYIAEVAGYNTVFTPTNFFETSGSYTVTFSAQNISGNSSLVTLAFTTEPHYTELYVDAAWNGPEAGKSTYPFKNIQKAFNYLDRYSLVTTTVNITSATYTEALNISASAQVRTIAIIGTGNVVLDGNNTQRILNIGASNNCTIQNLVFTKGTAKGASTGHGGAIMLTSAALTLNNCNFISNKAESTNGGGALYNSRGQLYVQNSTFTQNHGANGGAIYNNRGRIYLTQSQLQNNTATTNGGAIYNYTVPDSLVTLNESLVRNNRILSTSGYGGAGIYSNGLFTAINTIFDDNRSSANGGALYNFTSGTMQLYHCNLISNLAQGNGGGIYNNYGSLTAINTIMHNNAGAGSNDNLDYAGTMPSLQACFPTTINQDMSPSFNNLSAHDYLFTADSLCIDTATSLSWVTRDYEGRTRPIGIAAEIGALEYKPEIDVPAGYIAYDEFGNTKNIATTASITIERKLSGNSLGKIYIPSTNAIDPTTASFRNIIITQNQIIIPTTSVLADKVIQLTLYTDFYPFIKYNSSVRSTYPGAITQNSDAALTKNISIVVGSPYITTCWLQKNGTITAVAVATINITPALIRNNHNRVSLATITAYDQAAAALTEVPVNITTNTLALIPLSATENFSITHSASAESGTITINYGTLSATASLQTYVDDTPPTINITLPFPTTNVAITSSISCSITDNLELATASVKLVLNNIDITSQCTTVGTTYTYSQRLLLGTSYTVTITASDAGGNTTTKAYTFTTKLDTLAPQLSQRTPTQGAQFIGQSAPLQFTFTDNESGISPNSLSLMINGSAILPGQLLISSNTDTLSVTYNTPTPYALLENIFITVNIEDNSGNTQLITWSYTIIGDTTPPKILIQPLPGTIPHNISLNAIITDNTSIADIVLIINNTNISSADCLLTPIANGYDFSYITANYGYNRSVQVTLNAYDDNFNSVTRTLSFTTEPDLIPPSVSAVYPTANAQGIDIRSPIVFEITDNESGVLVNLSNKIVVNGVTVPDSAISTNLSGNTCRVTCSIGDLDYLATITVSVTAQDNGFNPTTYIYSFTTSDDVYIPVPPTIDLQIPTATYYSAHIKLNGELEANHQLLIYAGSTLVTQQLTTATTCNMTVIVPSTYLPGTVTLSAISVSKRGNRSATSNILTIAITNNSQEIVLNGITANIIIPATTFDRDTELQMQLLPVSNPDPAVMISYMLSINPVALYSLGTPVQSGPVNISLSFATANPTENVYSIFYLDTPQNIWRTNGITVHSTTSTNIQFSTTHFTLFGIGYTVAASGPATNEVMLAPNPVALEKEPLHIVYNLERSGHITVKIYTINGELLHSMDKQVPAGPGELTWNGDTLYDQTIANGVYIALITIEDNSGKTYRKKLKLAVLN